MPRDPQKGAEHRSGRRKPNPLYGVDVSDIDYKDSAMLRRFISDRGKIRSRRTTGLTPRQQRAVAQAIKNAREMGLLPYPSQRAG